MMSFRIVVSANKPIGRIMSLHAIMYCNCVICFASDYAVVVNRKESPLPQTKFFEVVQVAGLPVRQAAETSSAELCRVAVGSILEITEEQLFDTCNSSRSGRLADGRGWIMISDGTSAWMRECMQPFAAGADVIPGAVICCAALLHWRLKMVWLKICLPMLLSWTHNVYIHIEPVGILSAIWSSIRLCCL